MSDPTAARPTPAALLMTLQVAVILGFSAYYAIELAQGLGDDATRVAMSIVTFVVGAACLAALAWGLSRRARWAITPTILWNVFLVIIGVTMMQGGQPLLGALLVLAAALTIVVTLRSAKG